MKALVLEEYMKFVYKDVETPKPQDGEVLIKIEAVAVCGSDVHGMDGSSGRRRPPIIMGHEAAGTIAEIGNGVEGYNVGDRVTFDSTIYCNECSMCEMGNVNLCDNRRVLGVSCEDYKLDGAFAEYVVVPSYILYRLPDNVTFTQASMVEPLSIAYHAATRVEIAKGASVAIVGVGTIGMLILQVVKAMGAENIIAIDIDDEKLQMALKMGASSVVNSKDKDAIDKILSKTKDNKGVDFAFDATGIEQTVSMCLKALALNGKLVLVGNLAPNISFPLQWVVTRQLSLFGSCASAGEYNECIKLISEGKVDVDSLISKTVPMSEGHEWITKVYNREDGLNKIVMIP
ncbi:MAG: galactitol-1-phosphate 5-dehydrogenase [Eubacteriales bacterium]|nr:galactitol-1-phosphate 5-dehydrogenase [Eubacteriales bacterium]